MVLSPIVGRKFSTQVHMSEEREPVKKETADKLSDGMRLTLESCYHELYVDLVLMDAIKKGMYDDIIDKDYLNKVVCVHSNVCYAILCFCVQCRASLKATLNVEKQYSIRRSVVTAHEIYKYLYGFTGKNSPWLTVEQKLNSKYPKVCEEISLASQDFLHQYAQESDGTLRDVTKHFSDNPIEFFENMEKVNERTVTDRMAAALRFLHPIHYLLVNEIRAGFGETYTHLLDLPMPKQEFMLTGIESQEKIAFMQNGIEKYSGMVNTVMRQKDFVEKKCKELNINMSTDPHWNSFVGNNIGLHILYIYLDVLSTFRAFAKSETYAEFRQNLAYLIMSVHEGLKKMYGFDQKHRDNTFWERAIMRSVLQSGRGDLRGKAVAVEARLEELSQKPILNDENMITAFTHMGPLKRLKTEAPIAVLNYYVHPIKQEDINALSDFIYLMNDVLTLYNEVLGWENKQIQQETADKFSGYYSSIDRFEQIIRTNVHDEAQRLKWSETLRGLRGILGDFERMGEMKKEELTVKPIVKDSQIVVQTKRELFLKLASLNYLNALVKLKGFKEVVNYGMIKPNVVRLVFDLAKTGRTDLYEELTVKVSDDSVFIRCYGLQFSFHHINAKALTDNYPQLCNPEAKWDGIKLQSIAKPIYELAKEAVIQELQEPVVTERINLILQSNG